MAAGRCGMQGGTWQQAGVTRRGQAHGGRQEVLHGNISVRRCVGAEITVTGLVGFDSQRQTI